MTHYNVQQDNRDVIKNTHELVEDTLSRILIELDDINNKKIVFSEHVILSNHSNDDDEYEIVTIAIHDNENTILISNGKMLSSSSPSSYINGIRYHMITGQFNCTFITILTVSAIVTTAYLLYQLILHH